MHLSWGKSDINGGGNRIHGPLGWRRLAAGRGGRLEFSPPPMEVGKIRIYICKYVCMYVCIIMYVCHCMYMYVCMNVCMYVCMYIQSLRAVMNVLLAVGVQIFFCLDKMADYNNNVRHNDVATYTGRIVHL